METKEKGFCGEQPLEEDWKLCKMCYKLDEKNCTQKNGVSARNKSSNTYNRAILLRRLTQLCVLLNHPNTDVT